MAKINNSGVIQKLVDELDLSPAKDVIPTELADKILPVFQINSEELIVKPQTANIVESVEFDLHTTPDVIYTVPATGKFFLTNIWAEIYMLTNNINWWINVTINGVTKKILGAYDQGHATIPWGGFQSLNLQNPILLDPESVISIEGNEENAAVDIRAGIVGYTETD